MNNARKEIRRLVRLGLREQAMIIAGNASMEFRFGYNKVGPVIAVDVDIVAYDFPFEYPIMVYLNDDRCTWL